MYKFPEICSNLARKFHKVKIISYQYTAVFEKTRATTQNHKKSCFWILEKRLKNVKKSTYSITGQAVRL